MGQGELHPARAGRRRLAVGLGLVLLLGGCAGLKPITAAARPPEPEPFAQPESLTETPRSRELYLKLIEDMRASGRAHAALAHLDEFDRQYPREARAHLLRGDCLADVGEYAQAEAVYRKLLRGRAAAQAYAGLGRISGRRGDWPAAAVSFESAVERAPTDPDLLNDLGYALLQSGRPTDAVFRLRQAHELAPGDAKVRNNLILALQAAGQGEDARALVEEIADPQARAEVQALLKAPARPAAPQPIARSAK